MIWHWLIFGGLSAGVFFEQFTSISKNNCAKICRNLTILFIFLAAIRWDQNVSDWREYHAIYSSITLTGFWDIFEVKYWAFEPIFLLVIRTIRFFLDSYVFVQLFMACIAIGLFYIGVKYIHIHNVSDEGEYGIERSLIISSFLVFWATTFANVYTVRTNLAAAVCVYSLRYIEKKRPGRFVLTVLIASGLHFSSLIFLLSYYVYHKQLNMKNIFLVAVGTVIVGVIGIDKFIGLVSILGGRYAEKISRYNYNSGVENFTYYLYTTKFLIIRAFANTLLVLIACMVIRNNMKSNRRFDGMFNIYLTGAVIQILTLMYNIEFSRVAMFFQTFQYFLLPYAFRAFKKSAMEKVMIYILFVAYMAVKMYSLYHREAGFMTFSTIFDQ